MRAHYKSLIVGLLGGILAFTLSWSIWTLITDHQRLNVIWDLELRRAQAATPQAK